MQIRNSNKILFLSIFTLIFYYIVYFGFTTNYSKGVFSVESFQQQYDNGIYQYRILSKNMLLAINSFVEQNIPLSEYNSQNATLLALDDNFSLSLYYSYFIQNTLFAILTTIVFFFVFKRNKFDLTENESFLLQIFIILMIALSQFTIVPYDTINLFFMALFLLYFLSYEETKAANYLYIMGAIVASATLNRETSALLISFFFTYYFLRSGWNKRLAKETIVLLLFFAVPYVALRILVGDSSATITQGLHLKENLTEFINYFGMFFWIAMFYLLIILAKSKEHRKSIYYLHLFSIPYILTCAITGVIFETRLYIPIFILGLVLTQMKLGEKPE